MKSFSLLSFGLYCGLDLLSLVAGHLVRSPPQQCDVSSAYSVLWSVSTGSSFCSTLLYPNGPSTTTITVLTTSTKPCETVTTTETDYSTKTVVKTSSTELSSVTYKEYSTIVLVPSGSYPVASKRSVSTASTSTTSSSSVPSTTTVSPATTTSTGSTVSAAAVSAAGHQQCSPTPSQLCNCPPGTVSAACSSLVPSPSPVTSTETDTSTVKCPKSDVTVTQTVKAGKTVTTYTMTLYPPPSLVSKKGVLTTTVPAPCADTPYVGTGSNGEDGDAIELTYYPNFPQTAVECCVLCFDPTAYPNCVASAFIASSLSCELLVKVNATAGEPTSPQCPVGIENYEFGKQKAKGNIYPGPCGY